MSPGTQERLTSPVGLALAGGAPGGAIYEIGALRALDEAILGLDLRDCGCFVGVSAGAFLGACLANGLSTAQQVRAIVKHEPGEHPFVPETFFRPAIKELGLRLLKVPGLLGEAVRDYVTRREGRLLDALTVVGQAIPVGIFDNDPIRDYVHRIFSIKGRTDEFHQLRRKLTVVTTDLESGESMRFGHLGWSHVPISVAVQASTALPGLYPPVEINGRQYVDGILLKTMHASVALEAGAELVFCINPLVPVDTRQAVQENRLAAGQVTKRGLPSVMSQTVRTLIHSRMVLGVGAYETKYPDADVVLIEPPRDDYQDFFSNIFSFASRRAVVERAYDATRESLRSRRKELVPILERHGLGLDIDFLEDESRDLWVGVGLPEFSPGARSKATPESESPSAETSERLVSEVDETLDQLSGLLDRIERWAEHRSKQREVA
ncbi:MAG: patatin-like phospholipase family protein [Thermoanaerobaculia bacterium]|nr:patatin-like phospholipase family protein [Thermoanaerobaculia bacterium]